MLRAAVPECRHICICDEEYRVELQSLEVETWPLWDIHGKSRTSRHGFDCVARLGLWGLPGAEMAEILGIDVVQWIDADVMVRRGAREALTRDWNTRPEMFWIPRECRDMGARAVFGDNVNTWLGVNGSMARVPLGSRPDWWNLAGDPEWVAETEARICGSDQALLTRLLLEEMGEDWREPNTAIFNAPHFGNEVVPWGVPGAWEVAFFPYDPFTKDGKPSDFTKPWLTENAYLRREWRVLAGIAAEEEVRAEANPALRRFMRRGPSV